MSAITSPPIQNNSRRAAAPTFPVWSPSGEMQMHTRENINDLVRHLGWFQKDPIYLVEQANRMKAHAESVLAAAGKVAPGTGTAPQATAQQNEAATPRLTVLRKELSDAGGIPDPTWGVAKLEQALVAAKAGVPLPKDAEDE